jgi:hypothetical protein
MAITSVDIDREIVDEIKALSNTRTDREVINRALAQHLAILRQQELLERIGARSFTQAQLAAQVEDYPL